MSRGLTKSSIMQDLNNFQEVYQLWMSDYAKVPYPPGITRDEYKVYKDKPVTFIKDEFGQAEYKTMCAEERFKKFMTGPIFIEDQIRTILPPPKPMKEYIHNVTPPREEYSMFGYIIAITIVMVISLLLT